MKAKYLWNKSPKKRLFIETDASDLGWGACAYQFEDDIQVEDEGNYRLQNDMGKPKRVIEWISKAWTIDQLKLHLFWRFFSTTTHVTQIQEPYRNEL